MTDPLQLETRRRIYRRVAARPGTYLRELQRDLAMAMGALEYHLDFLVRAGLLTVLEDGNKRYFPTEIAPRDKRILAFLRQKLPRRALLVVIEEGEVPKARLVERLGVAPSTLNYHLKHLCAEGILVDSRAGREAIYTCPESEAVTKLLVAYQETIIDRMVDGFLEGMDSLR